MSDLATLSELKLFLNISDSGLDTLLQELLDRADGYFYAALGSRLIAGNITDEYHEGDGGKFMLVDFFPLNSISAIKQGNGTSQITLDSDEYAISRATEGSILKIDGDWTYGEAYYVSYNGGYATPPADITQAAIELAAYWYKRSDNGLAVTGLLSKTSESMLLSVDPDFPKTVNDILHRYNELGA